MRERSIPHSGAMRRHTRPLALALKPVCLAAALAAGALPARALPTGAQVSAGQVQVGTPQGGQLVIRQTSGKAGIDWQGFSIGAGERVQVQQPGASSILFNRVVGADPSVILGQLQANGRVFLSNPRGILFGAGSQVDVGGLVATTLNLDPQALANGRYQLTRGLDQPGELRAEGDIRASGTVALVGPTLVQAGSISGARVGLAAAGAVQVDVEGDGLIFFHMQPADLATRLSVLGNVLADGGSVEARAVARSGFADTVLNMDGIVRARSIGQREGRVVIDGGSAGITTVAGTVDVSGVQAAGERGGQAELLGDKLLLAGTARIDARGDAGGGTVLVGGHWQGQGPQPNARMTAVAAGAQIDASAQRSGDGGTVVVWSDQATRYQGHIAARGGQAGGDGGRVEVSGKQYLEYRGSVDLHAPAGLAGSLLLDPTNLTISAGPPDRNGNGTPSEDLDGDTFPDDDLETPTLAFADPGTNSVITAGAVVSQLGSASVTLQATGNIAVQTAISSPTGFSLSLQAGNNIDVTAPISLTGAGANLNLSANAAGGPASGSGRVRVDAALNVAGTVAISQGSSSTAHSLRGSITAASLAVDGRAVLLDTNTWNLSGNSAVASELGGTGSLVKQGGGVLTFTGANSYGGSTLLSGGTLQVSAGGRLPDATALTVNGAGTVLSVDAGIVDTVASLTLVNGSLSGAGTLSVANSIEVQAGSIALPLAGGASFSKTGGGTVTVTAPLSHGGTTTLSDGTLQLGAGGDLPNGGAVTLNGAAAALVLGVSDQVGSLTLLDGSVSGAGTLTANGGFDVRNGSIAVTLAGSGGLGKSGSGTVTLTAAQDYTGGTQVLDGTLRLGTGGALSNAGGLTVNGINAVFDLGGQNDTVAAFTLLGGLATGAGTLTGTAAHDVRAGTIEAVLGGSAGLVKSGPGTVTLSAAQVYSGETRVTGGTLALSGAGRLPDASALTLDGATAEFSLGAITDTVASLRLAEGSITGSGTLLAPGGYAAESGSSSAVLGTAGAVLTKTTSGTVVLSAANAHGDTDIQGGTLRISGSGASVGSGSITLASGAVLDLAGATVANGLASSGGTLFASSGNGTYGGAATTTGTTRLGAANGASLSVNGTLAGTGGIEKTGDGLVNFGAVGSYGGSTLVSAGTLRLGAANRLPNGTTLTLGGGTAELDLAGFSDTVTSFRLAGGTLTGSGSVTAGSLLLESGALAATLAGSSGTVGLDKSTGGTVVVSAAQAATGTTVINDGTLQLAGAGRLADAAALRLQGANAVFDLGGVTDTVGAVTLASGRITGAGSLIGSSFNVQSGSIEATLAGTAGLTKTGSGTVLVTAAQAYGGTTLVSDGTLQLGSGGGLADGGALTVSGASAVFDVGSGGDTVGAVILVDGRITGSGTLQGSGYTLQQGWVDAVLGGGVGVNLSKTTGGLATLSAANTYQGSTTVLGGTLRLSGAAARAGQGAVALGGAGTLDLAEGAVLANPTLASAGGVLSASTGSGRIEAAITLGADTTLDVADGASLVLAGAVGGSGGLTKAGEGSAVFLAANTYGGDTRLDDGLLRLQGSAARAGSEQLILNAGSTLDVADGATLANAQLQAQGGGLTSSSGGGTVASAITLLADTTVSVVNAADNLLLAGDIGGGFSLVKAGAGRLTLAGSNSHGGATRVDAGTLATAGGSGGGDALPDGGVVQLAAGSKLLLAGDETIGLLSGSGTVQLGSFGLRTGAAGDSSFDGMLAGGAGSSLTKLGSGSRFSLLGGVDITRLQVLEGNLTLAGSAAQAQGVAVEVEAPATLALVGSKSVSRLQLAGTLQAGLPGDTLSAAGGYRLLDSALVQADLGAGTLTSDGAVRLEGRSAAEQVLVNSGVLTLAAAQRLSDAGALQLANGAVLVLGGDETIASLADLAGLPADGSAQVALGAHTLTTGDATDTVFSGSLTGAGGLSKTGSGRFTLAGAQAYTGLTLVEAGTLATDAADRLADATRVQIANGAMLWLGGAETVAGFDDRAGQAADGSARLRIASGLLTSADAADRLFSGRIEGDGGLAKAGGGTLTLAGSADNSYTGPTQVLGGVLAIGRGGHLGAAPGSASPAHLLLDGGTLRIGSSMTLAANRGLALQGSGGTLDVAAGQTLSYDGVMADGNSRGVLLKTGEGTLVLGGASIYGGSTTVQAGLLQTAGSERLPDGTALTIAAGASLQLGGSQTLQSIDAQGAVTLAGSVTTSGDQTYAAPVTVAATAPIRLAAGGAITATAAGNRWNTSAAQPLSIDAASLQLSSADAAGVHADLVLGDLRLSAGSSRIDGGLLTLVGTWSLEGTAQLALVAHAASSYAPADVAVGVVDPAGRSLHFASDVIVQAEGSSITSAADTSLLLLSTAGGSIRLLQVANDLRGGLSALSANEATLSPTSFGSAWQPNTAGDANNLALPARQSVITLAGQNLRIGNQTVAIDGTPVPVDGVAADLVRITAGSLRTDPGSVIRARLWYSDEAFGTVRSTPGLQLTLLDPAAYTLEGSFGNSDAPIAVDVGAIGTDAPRAGLSAGFVQVLPKNGARGSTAVYLTGPRIGVGLYSFFHDGAGLLSEVPVLYNGFLPASPQLSGSLSSVASVSEQARKERFEEAVRTENVAVRLRAGVIAEVGPGRPATQGSDGIRLPEQCDPPWPALDCRK